MTEDLKTIRILKPQFGYWVGKYLPILILLLLCPLYVMLFPVDEIMYKAILSVFVIIWIMLFYTYLDMLLATKWIITEDEILQYRGLFYRKVDHLELYRITDYAEEQSFLQIIFRNKTVKITSGDPSHPLLELYGIDKKIPLIKELRVHVESQKSKRGIYEITN